MNYRELTRKLQQLGIEFRRQGRGSHEVWWDPANKLYTVIPNHGGKEIATGTVRKILKDLSLADEDLR